MKIVQALGAAILLVVTAGCGDDGDSEPTGPSGDADVSGAWTYTATIVEASAGDDQACTYSGVTLVLVPGGASSASGGTSACGTSSGLFVDIDVDDLVVDGTSVEFSTGELIHNGTVIGNSMSGTISDDIEGLSISGEWSAVRQ